MNRRALLTIAFAAPLWSLPDPRAQAQTAAALSFDVASVKVSERPWLQIAPQRSGGRIAWTTDLHYLIGYAFHMDTWRLSGPIPGSERIYEVEATTAASATDEQVRLMFQSLLRDRFKMESHSVMKDEDGYVLSVGKSGPKIKPVKDGDPPPALPEWFGKNAGDMSVMEGKVVSTIPAAGVAAVTGRRASMQQLAGALERMMHMFVRDETGLAGKYYFGFEYAQENHPADVDLPPLPAALQEELGLKLEKRKGPLELLVVDRIDKTPTEN